ncbi:unnamed protein product, partial [Mesorhabditis spiculigera]
MDFANLPTDVLLTIFKQCNQADQARGKRLNKRLHGVLNSRCAPKPSAEELRYSVVDLEVRRAPLGRPVFKRSKDTRRLVTVHLNSRLAFEGAGISFDKRLFSMLLAHDLKRVDTIHFTLCHVYWSARELAEILGRTSLKRLNFEFCLMSTGLLSDEAFAQLEQLESLTIQPRGHHLMPELTGRSLKNWLNHTPKHVQLADLITGIRIRDIVNFLQKIPTETPFDWDLGTVQADDASSSDLARLLMLPNFSILVDDREFGRRIVVEKPSSPTWANVTPLQIMRFSICAVQSPNKS